MKYPLCMSSWGEEEVNSAIDVLKSGNTTMGEQTYLYEQELAELFESKFAVAVNSGSSANLIMTACQFLREDNKRLKRGDEIIVPALGWSTSYSPLQQYGLKLRFVDVNYGN